MLNLHLWGQMLKYFCKRSKVLCCSTDFSNLLKFITMFTPFMCQTKKKDYFRENAAQWNYIYIMKLFNTFIVVLTIGVRSAAHLHNCSPQFFTNFVFHQLLFTICDLSCFVKNKPNNKEQITNKQNLFHLAEKFVKPRICFSLKQVMRSRLWCAKIVHCTYVFL